MSPEYCKQIYFNLLRPSLADQLQHHPKPPKPPASSAMVVVCGGPSYLFTALAATSGTGNKLHPSPYCNNLRCGRGEGRRRRLRGGRGPFVELGVLRGLE